MIIIILQCTIDDLFTGVDLKKFTLIEFNKAKNEFDYGPKDVHYITEDMTFLNNKYSVRCHAREMWTLVKHLSFIMGKLLRPNDPLYKFALVMMDLLDICLKNDFDNERLQKLVEIVKKHNKMFLRLFNYEGNIRLLPPKAHHLLHYRRVVEECGPLKGLWSMRFESKHQQLKTHARVMYSRRNVCYSFAKKLCFHHAYNMIDNTDFFKRIKQYSTIGETMYPQFRNPNCFYKACKKAIYVGSEYKVGDYIVSNCNKFAHKIIEIGVNELDDSITLVIEKINIHFEEFLRAFKILDSTGTLECTAVGNFTNLPINKHTWNGHCYLRSGNFYK